MPSGLFSVIRCKNLIADASNPKSMETDIMKYVILTSNKIAESVKTNAQMRSGAKNSPKLRASSLNGGNTYIYKTKTTRIPIKIR